MKKIVLILVLLTCFASSVNAETHPSIEVKVNGMVCDFCAQGLKKTFGKIDVIQKVDVSLEKGVVSIWLKKGESISDKDINKAIIDNGISVVSVESS